MSDGLAHHVLRNEVPGTSGRRFVPNEKLGRQAQDGPLNQFTGVLIEGKQSFHGLAQI